MWPVSDVAPGSPLVLLRGFDGNYHFWLRNKLPLLVTFLAYMGAHLLSDPLKDLTQPTGGLIGGFGLLLNETTLSETGLA